MKSDEIDKYVYQIQRNHPDQIPGLQLETITLKLQNMYHHLKMTDCLVMYTQIPSSLEDRASNCTRKTYMQINSMQRETCLQMVKQKMALLDKLSDKWKEYIRKQQQVKWEQQDRREQKWKEIKLRWETVHYRRTHKVYPSRQQRKKDKHHTAMPRVMSTVHLVKPVKDLEAQEDAQEKYKKSQNKRIETEKKSQNKRIETEKKQVHSTVLQVPVAQKLIAEEEMRVKSHMHSPKTKEICLNLGMKRKRSRSRSRSPEQTSVKGKRRKT